jgi:ATP-dependent DNA helicase UvrD/PcrA
MAEVPSSKPDTDSFISGKEDPPNVQQPAVIEVPRVVALNEEKVRALEAEGNVLVIANPGTGKTLLLAHKYAQLIGRGVTPDEILCLTYTNKAVDEMRQSIVRVLGEMGLDFDLSRIRVTTFHAYALEAIGAQETISNNLLRYAIYRYLVENRILTYGDAYLISTVVPKIEDSIRYLKSFGVLPDGIDLAAVKAGLTEYRAITKEEMDRYAEAFVEIFKHYEAVKAGRGIDYADMLLEFTKLQKKPHFQYALVDELQDASAIEAKMVLDSCETFFVVGDKKQAIFAFQGGSILNFAKFEDSTKPILSENFRSTNQILEYARAFFLAKTKERAAAVEMRDLRNTTKGPGPRPKVYSAADEDILDNVCELVQGIRGRGLRVAVLARTNSRVREISEELDRRGVEHSSTYFQASDDAHDYVVRFLLGIFSDKARDVKNAMFTPFFPVTLKEAFSLAQLEDDEFLRALPERCPEFRRMKQKVRKLPDVDELFRAQIIPVAVAYGREYLMAALDMQKAFAESMRLVGDLDLKAVITYLRSSDLAADESRREKDVVLTTVHKAKGRQFEAVIYAPQEVRGGENFQDQVVKQILRTRSISVEEELEEEPLRIDFVALTRAKDELHVVTENPSNFLNDFSEEAEVEVGGAQYVDTSERLRRAFSLFASGDTEKSRELLGGKAKWLKDWIQEWFDDLDHVSFSSLPEGGDETAAQDYLISKILDIRLPSSGLEIGSQVHEIANAILKGEEYSVPAGTEPFVTNVQALIAQVKAKYPEVVASELDLEVSLQKLVGSGEGMNFQGRIDAVFRDGAENYLIVDWKTDKDTGNASTHRQQLQSYRTAYSLSTGVPKEKIKVAIGFVGLRGRVNIGRNRAVLDLMQPYDSAFETFRGKVNRVLRWKKDPNSFLDELGEGSRDLICKAVQEQFALEAD